jgi:S-adenosylmethionine:tRNA-ribosyltransferase-isomerase (queuine synthetase)
MKMDLTNQEDVYMTIKTSGQEPLPQYINTGGYSGEGKDH